MILQRDNGEITYYFHEEPKLENLVFDGLKYPNNIHFSKNIVSYKTDYYKSIKELGLNIVDEQKAIFDPKCSIVIELPDFLKMKATTIFDSKLCDPNSYIFLPIITNEKDKCAAHWLHLKDWSSIIDQRNFIPLLISLNNSKKITIETASKIIDLVSSDQEKLNELACIELMKLDTNCDLTRYFIYAINNKLKHYNRIYRKSIFYYIRPTLNVDASNFSEEDIKLVNFLVNHNKINFSTSFLSNIKTRIVVEADSPVVSSVNFGI